MQHNSCYDYKLKVLSVFFQCQCLPYVGAKGFVHVSTLKCNFTTGIAVFIFYIEAMALQFVEKFMSYQK